MSFSSEVKVELENQMNKGRHCQLAELAAILSFTGRLACRSGVYRLEIMAEHPGLARKCYTLFRKAFDISAEVSGQNNCMLIIEEQEDIRRVLMALKFLDESERLFPFKIAVNGLLVQRSCCKRAFIRGAFLASGSMSDPHKSYHFEIVCSTVEQAQQLQSLIQDFGMDAKIVERKKHYVVYLKEGAQIVDMLNVMEAHESLMNLENVRIIKEMRNSVNRQVNCETANINKTVNAAVKQIEDIEYIRDRTGFDALPDNLREMALVRLEHPDAPLKELGEYLNPPVGKSGVNHRLRKISMIAENMRF